MTSGSPLTVELLGVRVRIRCEEATARRRLEVAYGRSLLAEASPRTSGPALEACLTDDRASWLLRVDGRAERREEDPDLALRGFHHELLHGVMLRRSDLYFVHAAVVVLEERALVLPGLSRAGKSTLALALVERGARFLSDELLAFEPATGLALAFPRAPKIRDECLGYFPRFAGRWVGQGEARSLPFDALGPEAVAERATPGAVVVPRWRAPDEPGSAPLDACVSLSPGRALLALTSSSLNFGAHREASLERLARLVEHGRCASIDWRDPGRAAHAILDFVRSADA